MPESSSSLRPNSVGVVGIVFFVLAFAAPLTVVIGIGPIVLGEGGSPGAPGAFVLTALVLLVFSVGFAAMSRQHAGPGGFAVYIGNAFGRRAANAATYVAVVGYNCMLTAGIAIFSATAANVLDARFALGLPWWVYGLLAVALIALFGYRDVKVSVRVLGVLLIAEVLIMLVLDAAILITGGAEGINVRGFAPSALWQGGIGIVLLMSFTAFVGFEATTLFAEEARDRRRTIPRSTYLAVGLIGAFYAVSFWCLQIGWGVDAAAEAAADPTNFLFGLNTKLVGTWSTDIMQILVLTSIFAAVLSTHGALSRYLFAMGRNGLLPRRIGTTHPRMKSPHLASLTQSGVTAVVTLVLISTGADPLSVLYPWVIGIGSVAILMLYVAASIAVVVSLRRSDSENRVWVTTVAPVVSAVALGAILGLALANYDFLTGSDNIVVNSLWIIAPLAGVIGFALPARAQPISQHDVSPEPSEIGGQPHDATRP
jgi:amino acid transporter